MPPRKNQIVVRKNIRKRRNNYNNRKIVYIKPRIPLSGIKNSEIVKMRYVTKLQLIGGSGSTHYHFRANSLYDPDYDGAGHQPMGFDQMALKYNHYQVLGSRIKITQVPLSTASAVGDEPSWVTVTCRDNVGVAYTTIEGVLESVPYGKQKKLFVCNYAPWHNYSGNVKNEKVLTAYYDPKKMFGLSKQALSAEEDLKPLVNANPNEDAMFQIGAYPCGGNTNRDTIQLLVEIDYTARFSEPKEIAQS